MYRVLFILDVGKTVHGSQVEKKDDQRVYVSLIYVPKWGLWVSTVPGDVAILESVVDTRRGRELSTVVVWQLLAEEENCLRSSPGSCLPKKRIVFGRRLAVAC